MRQAGGPVIVIPTIRPESYKKFRSAWDTLIANNNGDLVTVWDGKKPYVEYQGTKYSVENIMGKYSDLIYNFNDGVRNLGFAFVKKNLLLHKYVITLDDDVEPSGDTIKDHINALEMRVPVSWISTTSLYTRGFPYGIRDEAEVVLSHGVWNGVKDWDAPTQLVRANPDVTFYKGPIPKGILYPMCAMNLAFKRKALPIMYQAPMGHRIGLDRFADIWCGIESKKEIDAHGWGVVSGYATVNHMRASNVFTNLKKEAKGLEMNEVENYGKDEYFKLYQKQRSRWKEFCALYP
jgi:reversibly glycosylated polypeptide/UDP-arabinopyranose mutase